MEVCTGQACEGHLILVEGYLWSKHHSDKTGMAPQTRS